jgi:hypothetical protein
VDGDVPLSPQVSYTTLTRWTGQVLVNLTSPDETKPVFFLSSGQNPPEPQINEFIAKMEYSLAVELVI